MIEHASYADWLRAYDSVYELLPGDTSPVACPNCGKHELRIVFVARERDRVGSAMFWCDFCRFGIHLSRTWVPRGVDFYPIGTPWDELGKTVPDYTLVYPPLDEELEEAEPQ